MHCAVQRFARRYIAAMSAIPVLLERLGALLQQLIRDEAARHGLLPVHLMVLHYLARANRYSDLPVAIAEYLGLTRGTVSQTLAVLERRGMLTRSGDAQHGRRVHLALTPAGEAVLRDGWPVGIDHALGAAAIDRAHFEAALTAILSTLQATHARRAFGVCNTCAHFLREIDGTRCGLTKEPLAVEQTVRLCREWTAPAEATHPE